MLPRLPPKLRATRPSRGKRLFGALGDHASLLIRDHRHDPYREPVRSRHVSRDEINAGLLQPEQEVRVSAKLVDLGDNGFCQGSRQQVSPELG